MTPAERLSSGLYGLVAGGRWESDVERGRTDSLAAACLLDSLLESRAFDPADFGDKLALLFIEGRLAPARQRPSGGEVHEALLRASAGTPLLEAGTDSLTDGSLVRAFAVALWHDGPDNDLVAVAMQQSRATHWHARVLACCALYAAWSRRLLLGDPPETAWELAEEVARGCVPRDVRAELNAVLSSDARVAAGGQAREVVASLLLARRAARAGSYAAAASVARRVPSVGCGPAGLVYGVAGSALKVMRSDPVLADLERRLLEARGL